MADNKQQVKQQVTVAGRRISLSSLDKVVYPGEGIVKAEVVQYAARVAEVMLRHVGGRPLSLVRYPDGIEGESFFQKNRPKSTPSWVESVAIPSDEIQYLAATEEAVLVWLANQGALEVHQMHARKPHTDRPDYLVVDLDPPPESGFLHIRDLAFRLRDHAVDLGYDPLVKTTGGKGLHVVCPLEPEATTEEVLAAAKDLAKSFRDTHPKELTLQLAKAKRQGRVFVDILRHNPGQTIIAAYSLRGRPGAPVSLPITWERLEEVDDPRAFNVHTVPDLLDEHGDAWEDFDDHRRPLHTRKPKGRKKASPPKAKSAKKEKDSEEGEVPKSLEKYAEKRRFNETPEPAARPAEDGGPRFVVQRHHASRLHYDLRLEKDGVLLSWAVPKGLPPRPGVKRLAVQTEDHPVKYLTFEGTIPKGNYGAGEMWVFDSGEYEVLDERKGRMTFRLGGNTLSGEYRLIKTKDNQWLLERLDEPDPDWLKTDLEPMALVLVAQVPSGKKLEYEVKWDGIRALIYIDDGDVRIITRNGTDVTDQFPELADAGAFRATTAILDGEIVVLKDGGVPDFGRVLKRMQRTQRTAAKASQSMPATCYLFDCLYLDGRPITQEPLRRRREWLEDAIKDGTPFRFSRAVSDGKSFLAAVDEQQLEGIVAKDPESVYEVGKRPGSWIKIKIRREAVCVIIGFTPGKGSNKQSLGSIHVAELVDDMLEYRGRVGTGMTMDLRKRLIEQLADLSRKDFPLNSPAPKDAPGTTWVQPSLMCEVAFAEITEGGRFRKPSLIRLRPDLDAPASA